jgi:hypothetical protein
MKVGLNLKHEFSLNSTYNFNSLLAVDSLLQVVKMYNDITAVYSENRKKKRINTLCDQKAEF